MRILIVFDSSLRMGKDELPPFNKDDTVYLFPLTSKTSITTDFVKRIKITGCEVEFLQTAEIINSAADKVRDKYIRFIAELPERVQHRDKSLKSLFAIDDHATMWWFSLVAEKNTFKSDAFNRLVQLDTIVNTVRCKNIDRIMFGCENRKLQNALYDFSQHNSIKFEVLPVRQTKGLKERIGEFQGLFYLKHIFLLLCFGGQFFLRAFKIKKRLGKLNRPPITDKSMTIITYYPNIDIEAAKDGIFKNKYYE